MLGGKEESKLPASESLVEDSTKEDELGKKRKKKHLDQKQLLLKEMRDKQREQQF